MMWLFHSLLVAVLIYIWLEMRKVFARLDSLEHKTPDSNTESLSSDVRTHVKDVMDSHIRNYHKGK